MARLWLSGFELNSAAAGMEVTAVGGVPVVQTTTFRSGARALECSGMSSGTAKGCRVNFAATTQVGPFFFRCYFRYSTAPSAANTIIQVNDTNAFTTQLASIELNNNGTLQLRDEDGTIGSPSAALSANTWYRIEFKASTAGGAGAHLLEAKLDGTVFATASNRSLSANLITFHFGANLNAEAQTTGAWYFDDIAINDGTGSFQNDYPGEGEIIILRPTGDSSVQWSRGGADSGANWSQLEELPPNDATDYVQSNTLDQIDLYTLGDTPAAMDTGDTINCVMPGVRFAVDNATGSDPDITIGLSVSGNADECSAIDVNSVSYFSNHNAGVMINYPALANNSNYEVPGTNTAWTKSDLDSALYRLREAATDTHFARVSAVWVYVDHKPGANQYTQDASGGMTPSGAIFKDGRKVLSGGNTPAGAIAKETAKALSGSNTPSGNLLKETAKILSGALSSIVGTLTTSRLYMSLLSGAITPSGTISKETGKVFDGTLTSSGQASKSTNKSLGGDISSIVGTLTKQTNKALDGAITSIVGTLQSVKTALISLGGTLTSSGTLLKQTAKNFVGSITPSGSATKETSKSSAGSVTPSGTITKQTNKVFAGTLTSAGSLFKQTMKVLAGILTSVGDLIGDFIPGGTSFFKDLAGTLSSDGAIQKHTTKSQDGSLSSSGSIFKSINKTLTGNLTSAGQIIKQVFKNLSGILSGSGFLSRIFNLPPAEVPKIYLRGSVDTIIELDGQSISILEFSGERKLYENLQGKK